MKQKTTRQLVQDLSGNFDNLSGSVENLKGTVQDLSGTVQDLSGTVKNLAAYTVKGFADINSRIDGLPTKEEIEGFKDGVYNKMDKVYGEVMKMRDEQSAHRQEHDDVDERLDNIEAIPVIAHELKKKSR